MKIAYTVYIVTEKWKQLSWLGPAVTEGQGDGDFPSRGNNYEHGPALGYFHRKPKEIEPKDIPSHPSPCLLIIHVPGKLKS